MKPPIDPAVAARAELASPFRYQLSPQPPPAESFWQRVWDAISDLFRRLFAHAHGNHVVSAAATYAVIAIALALIVYAVVRFVRTRARRSGTDAQELDWSFAEREDARLAREAYAAADRGQMTDAVRLLLRAAVALLGVRGTIDDDASATIGELRRSVHPCGERIAGPFDAIASAYVTGVYARRPIDVALWNGARSAYAALRSNASG